MPHEEVDGVNLHYCEYGHGEPLLLLHGLGSSAQDWELQIPVFSAEYRTIAVDLRGHGQSDKPRRGYSIPVMAQDVLSLITSIRATPILVVGLSMGGMVALQLAVDAPQLIRGLIVVNSTAELVPHTWRDQLRVWHRLALARILSMRLVGRYLAARFFPRPEQHEIREQFEQRWAQNDKEAYVAVMRGLVGWTVTLQLGTIRAPTLIVSADQDYVPFSYKEQMRKAIPEAELAIVPDSRHGTPVDQPEKFNHIVLSFLRKISTETDQPARVVRQVGPPQQQRKQDG